MPAHQHGSLQIGDPPSGQVPLQAVGEVLAGLGRRAGRARFGWSAVVARFQRRRACGEEGR
ncbi:hypothetical protein GCM10010424_02640 [Streptomyces lienomycini]